MGGRQGIKAILCINDVIRTTVNRVLIRLYRRTALIYKRRRCVSLLQVTQQILK